MIRFFVPGHPKAQPRARFSRKTGHAYNPDTANDWRRMVAIEALKHAPREPFDCPVCVVLVFRFTHPRSHYRTGKNAHLLKGGHCETGAAPVSGDWDNYAKAVCDMLTECGYWRDDVLITHAEVMKEWTSGPNGCEVRVWKEGE